jgi:hypothetical protein
MVAQFLKKVEIIVPQCFTIQVFGWPCKSEVPDLTEATIDGGVAILGKVHIMYHTFR